MDTALKLLNIDTVIHKHMLSVIILNVVMLSVIILNVVMLSVIILNVVMLSVIIFKCRLHFTDAVPLMSL
jgi:hypothetical protein